MSKTNRTRRARRALVLRAATLAAVAALVWPASAALAGPKGARVAKGNAKVETRGSDTVIRASDRAVINYSSFDVARGERVTFVQPSASARVLNRIDGGTPSRIDGAIRANGRVYFVNPSGVVFGAGSSVQAAGFVAAAANLSDGDFLAGVDRFTGGVGVVSNAGDIRADGLVALVGGRVENAGRIDGGVVALVAGGETYLSTRNSKLMVNVTGGAGGAAPGVSVTGNAKARSQFVAAAGDLYSLAVKTSGTINAPDVSVTAAPSKLGGASPAGVVDVAGAIDASSADGAGGRVAVTGDYVKLDHATVDASGATGGGTVEVGGGWQGTGDLAHARAVYVGADASIRADATARGDGGTVAVWSDGATAFAGDITARGGPRGGDGGHVETSGASLTAVGRVDTTAPGGGLVGEYLLDPANINIVAGEGAGAISADGFFDGPDAVETNIGVDAILRQLATSNVTISTRINRFNPTAEQLADGTQLAIYVRDVIQPNTGQIIQDAGAPIVYTGAANRALTLRANAGIELRADVRATGAGSLSLELRAREGYRYTLDELPAAIRGPELSEAKGPVFVDDNIYGNLLTPQIIGDFSTRISKPETQGVQIGGFAGPITIDTNGGSLTASGRFVRTLFQNTDFSDNTRVPGNQTILGEILSNANLATKGGQLDFRASGEITVGNIDTRATGSRPDGGVRMFSSQSYFPPRDASTPASVAGTPGSNAQVIFQNSGTTIEAGDGPVHLRGGAVILSGDALRGGHVLVEALGYIDSAGAEIVNSDIVIRDFVADETFANEFGFKSTQRPEGQSPDAQTLREAIADKRAGRGVSVADPTFRTYAIEGQTVELRGDVRANAELQLGIRATGGDLTIGRLTRTGRGNTGGIVNRVVGGALDGNAYVTLDAPDGTVRVEEAIGALSGRTDVRTAGTAAPPPNTLEINGKAVELASVFGGGPVRIDADDALRVIGTNPVWLSATGEFFVNRKPTFNDDTLDPGSVAPIYASPDFTLDPNERLFEFDLRQGVATLSDLPSTFTPFQFGNPSTTEQYLSVTFSGVAVTAAEEIAGATPQQTRGLDPGGAITGAVARTLSQVGVRIRDVRQDELLESLFGRAYYDDVAGGPMASRPASRRTYEMDPESMRSDSQVAKPRVPAATAERIVAKFNAVAMRPARDPQTGQTVLEPNGLPRMESRGDEIREHLGKAVDAYQQQNPGEIDPPKLRAFIDSTPAHAAAAKDVRGLQELLGLIGQLGLTPTEERQARNTTVGLAQPEQIDRPALERVIDPAARP